MQNLTRVKHNTLKYTIDFRGRSRAKYGSLTLGKRRTEHNSFYEEYEFKNACIDGGFIESSMAAPPPPPALSQAVADVGRPTLTADLLMIGDVYIHSNAQHF